MLEEYYSPWIREIWKVGGGSVMEFDYVANTPIKLQQENLRYALTLPYEYLGEPQPAHDHHVVIIGGGPSIADHLDEIRMREKHGQVIWALNNSFKYLKDNGINPHGHIILDAREKNVEFVPDQTKARLLYASICHPKVFEKAAKSGGEIVIWHPMVEGISDYLKGTNTLAISCGDTVGLQALGLAQLFGFQQVHIYGYDSSYRGDQNHAYPQHLNAGERVIEVNVNGEKFTTAAWMASQTDQFKQIIPELVKNGMVLTVHGTGLLPYVAGLMYNPIEQVPQEQAAE